MSTRWLWICFLWSRSSRGSPRRWVPSGWPMILALCGQPWACWSIVSTLCFEICNLNILGRIVSQFQHKVEIFPSSRLRWSSEGFWAHEKCMHWLAEGICSPPLKDRREWSLKCWWAGSWCLSLRRSHIQSTLSRRRWCLLLKFRYQLPV